MFLAAEAGAQSFKGFGIPGKLAREVLHHEVSCDRPEANATVTAGSLHGMAEFHTETPV